MDERILEETSEIINLNLLNNKKLSADLMESDTEGSGVSDLTLTETRNRIFETNITFSFNEDTNIFNETSTRSNLTNSTKKSMETTDLKNLTTDHILTQKSKYAVIGAVLGGIAAAIAVGAIAAAVAISAAGNGDAAGAEGTERVMADESAGKSSKNLIYLKKEKS